MPGLGEMLVAAPAAASLRDQNALARLRQIGDLLAGILIDDDGADRNERESCPRRNAPNNSSLRRAGRDPL